jgi:hypothetical protein
MFLRNVGIKPEDYMAQKPRRSNLYLGQNLKSCKKLELIIHLHKKHSEIINIKKLHIIVY